MKNITVVVGILLALSCMSLSWLTPQSGEPVQVFRPAGFVYQDAQIPLETTHFIISYQKGQEIFAYRVAELAESIYNDAVTFMRYTPPVKVNIDILLSETRLFPWESSFADRAYARSGEWTIMLIHGCPFSTEVLGWNYEDIRQALAHEMNHVLFCGFLGNDTYYTGISAHKWIIEGLATYCEKPSFTRNGEDDLMMPVVVEYLEEQNNFPTSLEEITFEEYGRLSYPLAWSVIQFMIDGHGEDRFYTFLDKIADWDLSRELPSQNVDNAFEEAFSVSREEFEMNWVTYVKEKYGKSEQNDLNDFEVIQITYPPGWRVVSSWHTNKILFVSDTAKNLDIFVMNIDGADEQQLTTDESSDFDPKFSPDGKKIAFTSLRDGYSQIYCMNADGSNIERLTDGIMDVMGSWSLDGKRIVFTSGRSGTYDVYVMNADGSHVKRLTDHEGDDGWPVFSPDGQKIMFVSDRNGSYDVYTMNTDGTGIEQLTNTPEHENFPQYSPDGKKIVFTSRWETGSEICIMNSDGSNRKVIVTPLYCIVDSMARHRQKILGYPVWSPDGKEIAFTAVNQIYIIPVARDISWIGIASIISMTILITFIFKKRFQPA